MPVRSSSIQVYASELNSYLINIIVKMTTRIKFAVRWIRKLHESSACWITIIVITCEKSILKSIESH